MCNLLNPQNAHAAWSEDTQTLTSSEEWSKACAKPQTHLILSLDYFSLYLLYHGKTSTH